MNAFLFAFWFPFWSEEFLFFEDLKKTLYHQIQVFFSLRLAQPLRQLRSSQSFGLYDDDFVIFVWAKGSRKKFERKFCFLINDLLHFYTLLCIEMIVCCDIIFASEFRTFLRLAFFLHLFICNKYDEWYFIFQFMSYRISVLCCCCCFCCFLSSRHSSHFIACFGWISHSFDLLPIM